MKRIIVALLFAIAMLPAAHAREICKPAGPQYIRAVQHGPGNNWFVWWWCDHLSYDWTTLIPSDYTSERLEASFAYLNGLNPGYMDGPPWRPADDPMIVEMAAAAFTFAGADTNRPPAPPPELWLVGATGKSTTRPTYPVVGGVRGKTSDGRATIGTPCDCSKPIVEGKTTYCPLDAPWQPGPVPGPAAAPPAAPPTVLPAPPPSVTVCVKAQ